MPVTIRNTRKDTSVIFSVRDGDSVEWKPAGDPSAEDIQQVPDEFCKTTHFLRAVGLGILVVESDDQALKDAIEIQSARYHATGKANADAIADMVDKGAMGRSIVISEADIDRHIAALSKSQRSDLSEISGPEESIPGDRSNPVLREDYTS